MKRLTDAQKATIKELRASGLGYKAIAKEMSLSRDTVRSFCTRSEHPAVSPESGGKTVVNSVEKDGVNEIKIGSTTFRIRTVYNQNTTVTLKDRMEKLVISEILKQQSRSYQLLQE